ncbi:hypothetical protein BpHYR1_044551 [Brachionus plicatilis]|uniref:Uncharacterized protein n=1 Tax=Brachionus plicatilis TaxID=10195 RepID=A0A3M7R245_BRAPC|nr:hypothetical protein BpHYR1_044551 [Brachionus plicatilis]
MIASLEHTTFESLVAIVSLDINVIGHIINKLINKTVLIKFNLEILFIISENKLIRSTFQFVIKLYLGAQDSFLFQFRAHTKINLLKDSFKFYLKLKTKHFSSKYLEPMMKILQIN